MSEENNNNTLLTPEKIEELKYQKVEESAKAFHLMYNVFRPMGYRLAERKKRAPIRVLEALVFGPLEDENLFGKEEKDLLDFCRKAMYHKNTMSAYVVEEKLKEEEKKNE